MKQFIPLISSILVGCTFLPPVPSVSKISSSKVENPFFSIPPENLKDYESRTWILLAQSKTKNWFYDPYSLKEDEEQIISFDIFYVPREGVSKLNQFNATMVGPYRQKIDCFGNYQWSEIFYADKMPSQNNYKNPLKPDEEWGWIKIKPKTSMAFVRSRICGRKFLDEKDVNFFLYQDGMMRFIKDKVDPKTIKKTPEPIDTWFAQFITTNSEEISDQESDKAGGLNSNVPIFYEVINNEIIVLDPKKDLRQIKIASYLMDKDFSKKQDYIFQANCQNKTYNFFTGSKLGKLEELKESKSSLESVAFDRVCGDHGSYMRFSTRNRK
jgi:hypothetical protein